MADPNLGFLAAGFGAVWLLLGIYLVYMARAQRRLADRIAEVERAARGGGQAPEPSGKGPPPGAEVPGEPDDGASR